MHEAGLILTLAGGLAAALVCGYATHRIGLSPIVGYLAAGLLVGPYTPGFRIVPYGDAAALEGRGRPPAGQDGVQHDEALTSPHS